MYIKTNDIKNNVFHKLSTGIFISVYGIFVSRSVLNNDRDPENGNLLIRNFYFIYTTVTVHY